MQDLFATPLRSALRQALLLGAALCVLPASFAAAEKDAEAARQEDAVVVAKNDKAAGKKKVTKASHKAGKKPTAGKKPVASKKVDDKPGPLADFGDTTAPADVMHIANWVSYTRNNQKKAFVVIDKKQAQLYLFEPTGKLKSHTPVLLGRAVGDVIPPGTASKPISQLKETDKMTPAGRFLAQPGKNSHGDNVLWIDYNAAISMHRLRKVGNEKRAERMATPGIDDNRISNGCVNVPPAFYDKVLRPTALKQGAYVYVLPETRTPQQLFGSYDVANKPVQLAQAPAAAKGKAGM
jgi:hypothetical protein